MDFYWSTFYISSVDSWCNLLKKDLIKTVLSLEAIIINIIVITRGNRTTIPIINQERKDIYHRWKFLCPALCPFNVFLAEVSSRIRVNHDKTSVTLFLCLAVMIYYWLLYCVPSLWSIQIYLKYLFRKQWNISWIHPRE